LIDKMTAKVDQQAATVFRGRTFPPARLRLGPPAFEAGFKAKRLSQAPLGEKTTNRQEIAVLAPVLEDREHDAALPRTGDELMSGRRRHRQRLVDNDRNTGLNSGSRQWHMRRVGRRDDDEIDVPGAVPDLR